MVASSSLSNVGAPPLLSSSRHTQNKQQSLNYNVLASPTNLDKNRKRTPPDFASPSSSLKRLRISAKQPPTIHHSIAANPSDTQSQEIEGESTDLCSSLPVPATLSHHIGPTPTPGTPATPSPLGPTPTSETPATMSPPGPTPSSEPPTPLRGFHQGDWVGFYNTAQQVAASQCPTPGKSSFLFELSKEAALHNSKILESHEYDLERAIQSQGFTHLSMGSELRPVTQLEPLLRHHPYWPELKQIALHGVDYPLKHLPEDQRLKELNRQLEQGNQESALTDDALPIVTKLLLDDIRNGFSIVVTLECLRKLKHAEVYPYGLIHQTSIDEHGNTIPKKRLKHNLSVRKKSGLAINQRVIESELTDTQYGFALSRHLHKIHAIRYYNPDKRILCNKVDIDKAFRRLHTTPNISAKCSATWHAHQIDNDGNLTTKSDTEVGTILTRLPFGSSPAPSKFSILSEISFDLAHDLMHCEHWDTDTFLPPLHDQIPQPSRLDDNIPFGPALPVDVPIPPDTKGGSEGFVDDGTNAVLDSPENSEMVKRTRLNNLMALHLLCRPHAGHDEPISRSHIASVRKLLAEGGLAEIYTFLGWLINTRLFTIALPKDKWTAWLRSIVDLLNKADSDFKELSTLVGRLEHVCYIIPAARHFMNRLRATATIADKFRKATLSNEVKLDLKLWIDFLSKAKEGISINNVVFRSPTSIPLTDASEIGIGGYCLQNNTLWRYEFTPDEQRAFSLNTKEFIAAAIGALMALEADTCDYPCILSLSDNSSTVSWLHKSNFDPTSSPVHNAIARWHASNLLKHNASDYSQHLAGSENHVADSLSRDFHLSGSQLLNLLTHVCPHLLPQNPQVISLPTHLSSWVGTLAQLQPNRRALDWDRKPSTIAAGVIGWTSPNDPKSQIPIWKTTPPSIVPASYAPSWMLAETDSTAQKIQLRETPQPRPQITWLRQSERVVGLTQGKMSKETSS